MKKLINLNVLEPKKDMIFIFDYDEEIDPRQLNTSDRTIGYMIPDYIVVGVFDDGSVETAGTYVYFMNDDGNGEYEDMFCFKHCTDFVDEGLAKAFVRYKLAEKDAESEEEAKAHILKELGQTEVRFTKEARNYLLNIGD